MFLNNKGICEAVEKIDQFLETAKMSEDDKIRIRLTVEEALFRCQSHLGEDTVFYLRKQKLFSSYKIEIRLRGENFDPFKQQEDQSSYSEFLMSRLNVRGLSCTHRYLVNINTLSIQVQRKRDIARIPGGDMASFSLLLTQLGLPLGSVGLMMVPCAFLDNIAAAAGMLIRDCELVGFAHKYQKS